MSDDKKGWVEAAELDSPLTDDYEEAEKLSSAISGEFRVMENCKNADYSVERLTTYGDRWVAVAVFTEDDAKYEWAQELSGEFEDDYRCVVEKDTGDVLIERRISE